MVFVARGANGHVAAKKAAAAKRRKAALAMNGKNRSKLDGDLEEPKYVIRNSEKESVRENLVDDWADPHPIREYSPQAYDWVQLQRFWLAGIVENETFQKFIVMLILLNAITIGLSTFSFVKDSEEMTKVFEDMDSAFLIIFTIELGMQFSVYFLDLFKDGWLVFDFTLIVFSWAFAGVTIIRSFRIFRALRLFARVGALKEMVSALVLTMPQMGAICAVFGLLYFIFSVMLTLLYKDLYEDEYIAQYGTDPDLFGRLDKTLLTLFFLMSTDNWNDIIKVDNGMFKVLWYLLLIFMLISTLILLNMVIAVLCNALTHLKESLESKSEFKENYHHADAELAHWFNANVQEVKCCMDDLIRLNLRTTKKIRMAVPKFVEKMEKDPQRRPFFTAYNSMKSYAQSKRNLFADVQNSDEDEPDGPASQAGGLTENKSKPNTLSRNYSARTHGSTVSNGNTDNEQGSDMLAEDMGKDVLAKRQRLKQMRMSLTKIQSSTAIAQAGMGVDRTNSTRAPLDYDSMSDSDDEFNCDEDSSVAEASVHSFRQITIQKLQRFQNEPQETLVGMFHKLQIKVAAVVLDDRFQFAVIALIVLNSFMMAIGTFGFVYDDPELSGIFEQIDFAFLVIFTTELCLQFMVHEFRLFTNGWLIFDFGTIFLSWAFASFTIVRSFRIFRAFRLFGRVKAMKQVIHAVMSTGPQLLSITSVLILLCYIFAVLFTQLYADLYDDGYFMDDDGGLGVDYFGRLDFTFGTLLMFLTFEGWSKVTLMVMEKYSWAWFPLVSFTLVGSFLALNLCVAMICDSLTALEDNDDAFEVDKLSAEEYSMYVLGWLSNQLKQLNSILVSLFEVQLQLNSEIMGAPIESAFIVEKYDSVRDDDSLRQEFQRKLQALVPFDDAQASDSDSDISILYNSVSSAESHTTSENVFQSFRIKLEAFVLNDNFQKFIVLLIAINSVLLGLSTFNWVANDDTTQTAFEKIDFAFLIIFTVELVMQLTVHGYHFVKDGWLVFDFTIIFLSWAFSGVTIIRSFRIFRAFRLFGRVGPLKRTIMAIASTGSQMGAIVLLVFVISYIYAVMLTNLFQEMYDEGYFEETGINYYGRLDYTAFTLMIFLTMDDWSEVVRLTQGKYWWAWAPCISFMLMVSLIVLNLIVAVLCEAITSLRRDEEEECNEIDRKHREAAVQDESRTHKIQIEQVNDTLASMLVIQVAMTEKFSGIKALNKRAEELQDLLADMPSTLRRGRQSIECSDNVEISKSEITVEAGIEVKEKDNPSNVPKNRSLGNSKAQSSSKFLTADESEMEEIDGLDENSNKSEEDMSEVRKFVSSIVTNSTFQTYMVLLIILNSIFMGIATFDWVKDDKEVVKAFDTVDTIFLVFFTVELIANLYVYRLKFFHDSWLNFDFAIIVLSWAFSGVKIVRAFRIFRAFRLFGRVKSLKRTTTAILSTGPEMTAIAMVLTLLFYIFAVMFTQLYGDLYKEGFLDKNYFGRLDYTLLTCLMLTTLEQIEPITRGVIKAIWWGWIPIVIFITIISYVVLNLVIAAFCESLADIRKDEKKDEEANILTDEQAEEESVIEMTDFDEVKAEIARFERVLTSLMDFQICMTKDESFIDSILENKSANVLNDLKESSEIEYDSSIGAADPALVVREDAKAETENVQDDDGSSIYNAEVDSIENFCNNFVDEGWSESDSGEDEDIPNK